MALSAGARLGPYEIVGLIGAGGMGEVYRARDPRLGREIAVKILPAAFGLDSDRQRRFEREARAAAALNHPNILAIYDIGTDGDRTYIVSELLRGETLRVRLSGGALSPRKAIEYAIHIAHGLAAAHETGIVHRDLKPENLFVTSDGHVKILDFGLAKPSAVALAGGVRSDVPTATFETDVGVVLGTVGYMAPEQITEQPTDHRADIFALGAICYEMLAGARAFGRPSAAETMTAVLREDPPDLSVLRSDVPPVLQQIVRHCLEKRPGERFQSTRDLAFALEAVAQTSGPNAAPVVATPASETPQMPATASRRGHAMIAAAALALGAAAAGGAVWMATRPGPARVTRTTIQTSGDTALVNTTSNNLAITPDGSRVVYGGAGQLLVRRLDQLEPTTLTGLGSPTPTALFIAPDGQWVGFFDRSSLKKVAVTGGPPVTVVENTGGGAPLGATWGADGTIVFATTATGGLRRVSAAGGEVETLTTPDRARGELGHGVPARPPGHPLHDPQGGRTGCLRDRVAASRDTDADRAYPRSEPGTVCADWPPRLRDGR